MALRAISRRVKMDLLQQEGDICEILFQYAQTRKACRLFLNELKKRNGLTRKQISQFSLDLCERKIEPDFSYSRDRFYATIRQTLLTLGFIAIEPQLNGAQQKLSLESQRLRWRDWVEVYVPVLQPINKRPPDGFNFARISWIICRKWNDEFFMRTKMGVKRIQK